MADKDIVTSKYIYKHESSKSVDIHHIITRYNRRSRIIIIACFLALSLLLNACFLLLGQEIQFSLLFMYLITGVPFVKLLCGKIVEKESVVIIPTFGVQLETHYRSGRIVRRFVPIDKILKPILNECVTPVTCYWSFALLLRDEDELMLVFQELRPPLKMLLLIWKELCAATNSSGGLQI